MSLIHINNVQSELAISFAAGINTLYQSPPARGKSQEVARGSKAIAATMAGEEFSLFYIDMLTATPNDVMAWMPDVDTGKLVCYPNESLPNAYKTPNLRGILVADEMLNGDMTTNKVYQKYFNGDDVGGQLRKPDGVMVVGMSNHLGSQCGVMAQSVAFLSRFEQLTVYSDPAHNTRFAEDRQWWPAILQFFKDNPSLIDNYEEAFGVDKDEKGKNKNERALMSEEAKAGIWANMRSWERVSRLEYAAASFSRTLNPQRCLASLGRGVGTLYNVWRAQYDKLASFGEIISNPTGAAIPKKLDELHITVGMLTRLVSLAQLPSLGKYIDRLPGDFRAMAVMRLSKRSLLEPTFAVASTKTYQEWMRDSEISAMFSGK